MEKLRSKTHELSVQSGEMIGAAEGDCKGQEERAEAVDGLRRFQCSLGEDRL